ncbi:MAG: acetyl-CoA C-acetyltransferase [Pseudomonadota bacterium]|jgi:acetyl-CoA C-acetyltransferase|nr:MAG: acetyl-CoA C-acetyltransferase [Pseudomonadota bacterium]
MLAAGSLRRVAIIGGSRIPFARAHGAYAGVGNQEMLTAALRGVVEKYGLAGRRLGDVIAGAVLKHSRDFNLVRESVLSSGLDPQTPGLDIQRACGTSLEAAILVGNKIALGQIDAGIAGGVDTISDPPVVFPAEYRDLLLASYRGRSFWQRLKPWFGVRPRHFKPVMPGVVEPRTGLSMGQSCELMAKTWQIPREEQDRLAMESHHKAAAAWQAGFYDDLVVPFKGLKRDNNVRADTSLEKLAKLRTVFDTSPAGTLTAGNSTPLTDGAAAVLLASEEWARANGLPVKAILTHGKTWAVDFASGHEGLLMAPAYAVSAMLKDANLALQDFDFYEIHEAFAAQVLCTLRAWESADYCRERLGRDAPLGSIDRSKLNIKGSSIALGHPFAATGARILASAAKLFDELPSAKRGLISVCTAGGMGVTAIVERP